MEVIFLNKFELFTLIFYSLDVYYDSNPSEELGQFLSEMSPFTFKQIGSADPAIFAEFSDFFEEENIELEESYGLAIKYVKSIKKIDLMPAFETMDEVKWIEGCKKYLATNHKGGEL